MGGGSKPDYPTTTQNTGLYGSSTTNSGGTTFTPTSFQSQLVNMAEQNIPNLFNQANQPVKVDVNDPYYLNRQAQLQDQQNQMWNTQVINPMYNQGLSRGSSTNELANMFAVNADRMNRQEYQTEYQRLAAERDRNLSLANQLMQWYTVPYSMQTGTSGLSQSLGQNIANYNNTQNQNNNSMWNTLASLAGTLGGAYLGGPTGAAIGSQVGNAI